MFAALKRKNNYEQEAEHVYAMCLEQCRQPVFYQTYGVPDSFDGRFDLLLLHVFLVIDRLKNEAAGFNQALFDVMFADMDQTLREMGIGDMGVPKRMREMMLAFNGRMHCYGAALADGTMEAALKRNLYGGGAADAKRMSQYISHNTNLLKKVTSGDLIAGAFAFEEEK